MLITTPADAFASDRVECGGRDDFVKITYWSWAYVHDFCLADQGMIDTRAIREIGGTFWCYEIRTGNNHIRWLADGGWHDLPRWSDLKWPNADQVDLAMIEILPPQPDDWQPQY